MKYNPIGYRVLVRPDSDGLERDNQGNYKSAGGIYIPESEVQKDRAAAIHGTLFKMGPLAFTQMGGKPCTPEQAGIKLGMKVMISKYGGAFLDDPETGERYIVLNDEDVICGAENG